MTAFRFERDAEYVTDITGSAGGISSAFFCRWKEFPWPAGSKVVGYFPEFSARRPSSCNGPAENRPTANNRRLAQGIFRWANQKLPKMKLPLCRRTRQRLEHFQIWMLYLINFNSSRKKWKERERKRERERERERSVNLSYESSKDVM